MKLEKICGKIADIATYAYGAIFLALAIVSTVASDALQEFSFSLTCAGAVAWFDVALFAGATAFLIVMDLRERKTGVRKTKLRSGIILAVIGATFVLSFVAFIIAVFAGALSSINPDRPPYDIMDKLGLPIVYLPCIIILTLNTIACWANFRTALVFKPEDPQLTDPNKGRKDIFRGITVGIFTALSVIMLLYYVFLCVVFLLI